VPNVHPTAIVDPRASIAGSAQVGAYSIIKGNVTLGPDTIVLEHSHVHGPAIIGARCKIGPAAFVGLEPQHLRFTPDENDPTYVVIGDDVTIREGASVHRATHPGIDHATRLGNRVFAMGAVHVAHDCVIDDDAILANGALLGGHCHIGARAFLGGGCTLHQFTRIGRLGMIGGNEAVAKDVPPFGAVWERRLKGYNAVGCRRAGLTRGAIASIRAAYQLLHANRSTNAAVAAIRREVEATPEVAEILEFIAASKRGILGTRGDAAAPFASESSTA
jgi:UDP-N-acetylglucosamine acyltransferase